MVVERNAARRLMTSVGGRSRQDGVAATVVKIPRCYMVLGLCGRGARADAFLPVVRVPDGGHCLCSLRTVYRACG